MSTYIIYLHIYGHIYPAKAIYKLLTPDEMVQIPMIYFALIQLT